MSLAASGYYENKNGKFQTTWQQQRELVDKVTVLIHSQKTCVESRSLKKKSYYMMLLFVSGLF